MTVPYDTFIGAFLAKITEYDLLDLDEDVRSEIIEDYLKRALSNTTFKKVCSIDFFGGADDESRTYEVDADEEIIDELVDIVSDGMLVQWLKPYVYRQENLEQILSTKSGRFWSNPVHKILIELLEHPYSLITETEWRIVINGMV